MPASEMTRIFIKGAKGSARAVRRWRGWRGWFGRRRVGRPCPHARSPGGSAFFFEDPATTEIYTLSLHDALPISHGGGQDQRARARPAPARHGRRPDHHKRSEEHTSELQSRVDLVCRLLLEKTNDNRFLAPIDLNKKE